jgi:NADH-quinone oxidoreductase subunit K
MLNYLIISSIVFIIGCFGMFLSRKYILIILISIELILLSVNMNFIFFSVGLDDLFGQVCSLLVLTLSAAETAIGLAVIIVYYRMRGGISIKLISLLKS